MNEHPNRRGVAAALSGALVTGAVVGSVGITAPASAADTPVIHDFRANCAVTAGGLSLGNHTIRFNLDTLADVPLVPGKTLKRQPVSIELTMPATLQKAVLAIGVTHAAGGSPNSAVNIGLPIAEQLGGGRTTDRVALKDLKAAKAPVPAEGAPWKITSEGFVPRIHVPGFAGTENPEPAPPFAKLRLAPKFRINSTLFAKSGKRFKSVMKCTVRKNDRLINGQVPIVGDYVADTVPVHAQTMARKNTQMQLVFFTPDDPAGTNNSWTQPDHGTLKPSATGLFTYKPNRNFVGKDSFTYTAKDDTGQSTSKVTIRVRKAPTKLNVRAPKKIRFGKRTNVRVRVNTRGAAAGKVRLLKGKRVLGTARAGKAGNARLHIKAKALKAGKHKIRVHYAGSKTARKANARFTLRVLKLR